MSSLPDDQLNRPHSVYRCYDGDTLLYVGVAADVPSRMFHHLHPCNVGKQPNGTLQRHMTHYVTEQHPTKVDARAAERAAIQAEGPLLNKQHNPKRFRKVANRYEPVGPVHPLAAAAFGIEAA